MRFNAKYVHTNIVARDWKKLAGFYEQVFGCKPVPPERNLTEKWVEDCTGVARAEIRGVHLRLPGYGSSGPTLEIFEYNFEEVRPSTAINRPGLAHLAFAVDDLKAARDSVLEAGGRAIGKLVSVEISGAGHIDFIYVTDPENNIIELQRWSD